jgi:hypothetical protein
MEGECLARPVATSYSIRMEWLALNGYPQVNYTMRVESGARPQDSHAVCIDDEAENLHNSSEEYSSPQFTGFLGPVVDTATVLGLMMLIIVVRILRQNSIEERHNREIISPFPPPLVRWDTYKILPCKNKRRSSSMMELSRTFYRSSSSRSMSLASKNLQM